MDGLRAGSPPERGVMPAVVVTALLFALQRPPPVPLRVVVEVRESSTSAPLRSLIVAGPTRSTDARDQGPREQTACRGTSRSPPHSSRAAAWPRPPTDRLCPGRT